MRKKNLREEYGIPYDDIDIRDVVDPSQDDKPGTQISSWILERTDLEKKTKEYKSLYNLLYSRYQRHFKNVGPDKEYMRKYMNEYYEENKEKIREETLERRKKQFEEDPEARQKYLEYQKNYREKKKEERELESVEDS